MNARVIPVAPRRGSLPVSPPRPRLVTTPPALFDIHPDEPVTIERFKGAGRRLTEGDLASAAESLGCDVPALRAVLEIEAAGSGFRKSGVPTIRFEPHVFARETGGKHTGKRFSVEGFTEAQRVANRNNPEQLLTEAANFDLPAAVRSTSWGLGQIMGFNASLAGCESELQLAQEAAESEGNQLRHMAAFIRAARLDGHLRAHDWARFARGYNGPSFRTHDYDGKLARAYARFAGTPSWTVTDLGDKGPQVKRLQEMLRNAGFDVSDDGHFGPETEAVLRSFQSEAGLAVDGVAGAQTWTALRAVKDRDLAPPPPPKSEDTLDEVLKGTRDMAGTAGAFGVSFAEGLFQYIAFGVLGLAVVALGAHLIRRHLKK